MKDSNQAAEIIICLKLLRIDLLFPDIRSCRSSVRFKEANSWGSNGYQLQQRPYAASTLR